MDADTIAALAALATDPEAAASQDPEVSVEAVAALKQAVETLSAEASGLKAANEALTAKVSETEALLATANSNLADLQASVGDALAPMMASMRTALGEQAPSEALDAKATCGEFTALSARFSAKFKAGRQSASAASSGKPTQAAKVPPVSPDAPKQEASASSLLFTAMFSTPVKE